MESQKREKAIRVMATQTEYDALKARSLKPRLAEWMREHCLGAVPVKRSKALAIDPALLRQLAGLGNNLNQIARCLNERMPIDTVEIVTVLTAIERELCRLRIEGSVGDR